MTSYSLRSLYVKMADDFDLRSRMMGTDEENRSVMKTMILFSLAMLFLPVFSYFFSKSFFFEGIMGMTSQNSYFYAAFVAIALVHIILGLFVYKAFTEGTTPSPAVVFKPVKTD